jgi:hypothetical protein
MRVALEYSQQIMKPIVSILRRIGVRMNYMCIYLDEILLKNQSEEGLLGDILPITPTPLYGMINKLE